MLYDICLFLSMGFPERKAELVYHWTFEIDESMDLTTPRGFSNAVFQLLNVRPGGGHTSAPVCSTWVFMSRGSTHRSVSNPLGRRDSDAVQIGNLLAARAICLLLIASATGIFWVMEQPGTSLMYLHPLFQRLLKLVDVKQYRMNMSDYGGDTLKPTILYSSPLNNSGNILLFV